MGFLGFLGLLASATALPAALAGQISLTAADRAAVDRDRVVAKVLDTTDRREVMTVAILRVRSTAERFLACMREPRCLKDSEDLVGTGRLDLHSSLGGLEALPLDRKELDQLRACRPGDCDLRLTGEAIASFAGIEWSSPAAPAEATGLYRRTLLHQAQAYAAGGNRALPLYGDNPAPFSLAQSVQELLARPLFLLDEAPELRRYLTGFPEGRPERTDEFFTWYKERAWRKRIIAVNHVVIQDRSGPGGARVLVASKQLYASQCYESALELMQFSIAPGESQATLVFLSRARTDIRPTGFTWVERVLLHRLVKWRLEGQLARLRRRLETAPAVARADETRTGAAEGSPSGTPRP